MTGSACPVNISELVGICLPSPCTPKAVSKTAQTLCIKPESFPSRLSFCRFTNKRIFWASLIWSSGTVLGVDSVCVGGGWMLS